MTGNARGGHKQIYLLPYTAQFIYKNIIIALLNNKMYFPMGFMNIGGWSFERVWAEKQEFCLYALTWDKVSGIFKNFQEFCKTKSKNERN